MTTSNLRIALIAKEKTLDGRIELRLQSKGYQVITLTNMPSVIGMLYADPADIIIIDLAFPDDDTLAVVRSLKGDFYFSTIPVLGLIIEPSTDCFDWSTCPVDDFITLPLNYRELFSRIDLSLIRIQRVFDNNPLTKLPGNASIQRAIQNVLGKQMAVCYVDINDFKPYNDVFGFAHGDEVIRMLARLMANAVKESGGGFAGHIGGDDFVFIVPLKRAEDVSTTIISNFSAIAAELFDDETKQQGYYVGTNRKGAKENIPLLSIAIAIIPTNTPKMCHFGKVAEMAAEMKKHAKQSGKSCFVIDRRKD